MMYDSPAIPTGIRENESPPHYFPARMLNEVNYCPRLFYLEHVEGLFAHNADTTEGAARHSRVDRKTDELPPASPQAPDSPDGKSAAAPIHARSVTLSSERHGIIAKLDLIETSGLRATPVDYKRGAPRKNEDGSLGAWDPERIQMCAQALVLREHGYQCDEAIVFFWETRQRVRIPIDAELIQLTEETIEQAKQIVASGQIPPPLVDSPKCPRCSLVSICLPDETRACLTRDQSSQVAVQLPLFDLDPPRKSISVESPIVPDRPLRQLVAARDERRPLYLNTQGVSVGKSGEVLQVKEKGKLLQEVRLHEICQVNLIGSIQVTTQAIQTLLQSEIPLAYFSMGGWFYGILQPMGLKNILCRREQFRMADRPEFCLRLAKKLVAGKIRNQRTLLMRNHVEPPASALRLLKALQWEAERMDDLPSLLGIEGLAARVYFQNFAGLIKVTPNQGRPEDLVRDATGTDSGEPSTCSFSFDFERRNRRPPRDPINALLSLGYSLLTKDFTITCTMVGLDPFLGYYHQPRFGRPALALDLMEPFRPLIVDSAVLSAINQKMVTLDHFIAAGHSVALTAAGRKAFLNAYEQRMDALVTHPLFGYRVSYRRILEIQTRLLARVLSGEIWDYPVFVTR